MNHLLREHAPITDAGLGRRSTTRAASQLVAALAARKLVEFVGPHGMGPLGQEPRPHDDLDATPADGSGGQAAPGAPARRAAVAVHGGPRRAAGRRPGRPRHRPGRARHRRPAGSPGPRTSRSSTDGRRPGSSASPRRRHIGRSASRATTPSTRATWPGPSKALLDAGVQGPYGLALGPDEYTGVVETTEHGGLLVFDHLRQILGGPIVWAPGVEGAVVVSRPRRATSTSSRARTSPSATTTTTPSRVHLYVEESFTFQVTSPEAGIALRHGK